MKNLSTPSFRRFRPIPLILLAFVTLAAAASAQPSFTKTFTPDTIGPGGVSTLQFSITNDGSSPIRNLDFTDVLPAGVIIASAPNGAVTCRGGTLSAPAGGGTITYTDGGGVGGSTTCTVTVDVTSSVLGTHTNVSGDLTSDAGNSGSATADLTVAADRPGFSKSFSPSTVTFGGRSTLTFVIDNTANSQGAINLAFTDNLPSGMVVASPANASKTCSGGTLTATAGSGVVSLATFPSSASVAAGSSCTISVDVVANASGTLVNATGDLTSAPSTGGSTRSSGPATAVLTVDVTKIVLTKTFLDDPVPPGGQVTLGFTVRNLDRDFAATDISFTDDLDATLSGLTAIGLPLADPCGFGSSLSGTSVLSLTGGTLAAATSCTFSVTLQVPAAAATGSYANATSAITADIDGRPASGYPATDLLFVVPAPRLAKEFTDDPVSAGGSVTLELTITNTSATSTATDITFEDVFDVVLTAASATPAAGFCGAGSTATFTPLGSSPAKLVVAGASLAGGASCTFSLTLDVAVGATSGIYPNVTSAITATIDGETVTGNPASDDLVVATGLSLSKEFVDDPVQPGGTVTLRFSLRNVGEVAPLPISDIAFTDDLDAVITGLVAQGLPFAACGGTVSGTDTISFNGGSLAVAESCSFDVTLAVPSTAAYGSVAFNTTSEVTGTVNGHGVTAIPATDELVIDTLPPLPPTVAAPTVAPEPSDEGSAATASATFTDPQGAADVPFTCTVDYGDGSGPTAGTVSGFTCTGPPHVYGDNGSYPVTVVVTDKGGLSGSAGTAHEVLNVAPTVAAPAVIPEPSDEGSAVSASATFSDPGFDDTPFTCTVDYGDGAGPVAGTVAGTTCSGPAHTYADDGAYAVAVSVTDKDGGTGSAVSTHDVGNVAPTITGSTNSAAGCGATPDGDVVEVAADFSDPGFDNAAAGTFEGFTDSTIDWGDGTVDSATVDETPGSAGTPTTGTVSGSHVYATGGIYTVTVTVADDDGGTDEVVLTALVTGVGLNAGSLQIVGTPGKDNVSIKEKKGTITVKVRFGDSGGGDDDDDDGHGSTDSFAAGDVTLIEVQTCGGDDKVDVHNSVDAPAVLDGGSGRDHVQAGDGASFLFGGPGADQLFAGDAGDVLDGGPGNDHVMGGKGDDVLLGGEGNDQLFGRQGDDALDGGPGYDHCVGGSGTDTEVNCEPAGGHGGDDDDDAGHGGGHGDDDDDD